MEDGSFWQLGDVNDADLQARLSRLLIIGYRTEARIVAHLAEVEERRLHLRGGSSSMFDYCVGRLGLSNGEAFQRLTAARLARQFPVIFSLLERRDLHMSGLCLLRDYLTPENHSTLLEEASHKTKWQIQELLARRFPRADVATTIRKLPQAHSAPLEPSALTPPTQASESSSAARTVGAPMSAAPSEASSRATVAGADDSNTLRLRTSPHPGSRIEPTSADRYRLQLTMSASMREKLELARALLSHSVPSGDLAEILERALDELLATTKKQRFAQTKLPRRAKPEDSDIPPKASVVRQRNPMRREHVPNSTRREVVARDGLRCTFVSEDGRRCTASSFLQIHHERPWAKGGESTVNNLRLLCATHNRFLAEQDFGRALVDERREGRG
jgi:5-methylcytosine-specific restriction endonuclease McrA